MPVSVHRLNITPVKGLALNHPEEVFLTEIGVADNRRFFMVDEEGAMVSADRWGPMQQIRASYDAQDDRLRLEFPGGTVVEGEAAGTGHASDVDFFGRQVPAHLVPGQFEAALSAWIGIDVRLLRSDRAGDGSDVHHLTLVSRASVEALAGAGGADGDIDSRRFRMLFELDGCEPYEEDTWEGRSLRIGESTVRVGGQVPRCVITTQSPITGLKDFDTLKVLARSRGRMLEGTGLPFGMYAEVEIPGRVRIGDVVRLA